MSKKKFSELVLYAAKLAESDPRCGRTKLNKILFYADFLAFKKRGRSITGLAYVKMDFGPVPKAGHLTIDQMVEQGDCVWATRDYHGREMKKLIALREADLSLFSGEEVSILHEVVSDLWEKNGTEVSDLSHRFFGWQVAERGEMIPYEAAYLGTPRQLTEDEANWAEGVVESYRAKSA